MIYTISEIKNKVIPIAEKHYLNKVYLFGSYARGEADAKSDIDILIEPSYTLGIELFAILSEFKRAFLKKRVDMLTIDALNESEPFFAEEVTKDEVLIYEG